MGDYTCRCEKCHGEMELGKEHQTQVDCMIAQQKILIDQDKMRLERVDPTQERIAVALERIADTLRDLTWAPR